MKLCALVEPARSCTVAVTPSGPMIATSQDKPSCAMRAFLNLNAGKITLATYVAPLPTEAEMFKNVGAMHQSADIDESVAAQKAFFDEYNQMQAGVQKSKFFPSYKGKCSEDRILNEVLRGERP